MYANAAEAIDKGLRHKGTKEILATKNIAKNTKLVYLDDDCVGLRFHDTIIARYERKGVKIDTRDRQHPKGWFTVTTWDRINQFTPAKTFQQDGLRHILLDPSTGGWGGESRLFAHGAFVSPNGRCKVDMTREQSDAIVDIKRNQTKKVARHSKKLVKLARDFEQVHSCCRISAEGGNHVGVDHHAFEHFKAGEVVPHPDVPGIIAAIRGNEGNQPFAWDADRLAAEVERNLTERLRQSFVGLAIAFVNPDFPYPQIAPRRR